MEAISKVILRAQLFNDEMAKIEFDGMRYHIVRYGGSKEAEEQIVMSKIMALKIFSRMYEESYEDYELRMDHIESEWGSRPVNSRGRYNKW